VPNRAEFTLKTLLGESYMNRRMLLALQLRFVIFIALWPFYAIKLAFRSLTVDTLFFVLFGLFGYLCADYLSVLIVLATYVLAFLVGCIPAMLLYAHPSKQRSEDVFAVVVLGGVVLGILAHALVGLLKLN